MTIINTVGGPAPKPIRVEAVEDTPSTLPHTYKPSEGYDYLSSVTVGADPNLQAGNIKQGVSIFGVEGTFEGTTTTTGDLPDYYPKTGWYNYSVVIVCDDTLRDYTVGGGGTADEGISGSNLFSIAWPGDAFLTSCIVNNDDYSNARAVEVHLSAQTLTNRNMNYITQTGMEGGDVVDLKGYFVLIGTNTLTNFNPGPPSGTTFIEGEVTITMNIGGTWRTCDVTIPDIDHTFYTKDTGNNKYVLGFIATYGKVRP